MSSNTESSYVRHIKRNRVFILGSGFSVAAKIPLTPTLLKKGMAMFSLECPGIYERVNNYAIDYFRLGKSDIDYSHINMEQLCTYLEFIDLREYGGGERFNEYGSREKQALKFYLSKTLALETPTQECLPKLYVNFAEQLNLGDIVISFNWDGLLEIALNKLKKSFSYNLESNKIWLCKLNGSINWRLGEPNDLGKPVNTLSWQSMRFSEGIMNQEVFWSSKLLQASSWANHSPLREISPLLVLPGYGKAFDVRPIATLWYKPEFIFARTHDVYIIGLSLSQDDFFVRCLLRHNLPDIINFTGIDGRKIFIINPDAEIENNYDFLRSNPQVSLICENFCTKHVEMMKSKLNNL